MTKDGAYATDDASTPLGIFTKPQKIYATNLSK